MVNGLLRRKAMDMRVYSYALLFLALLMFFLSFFNRSIHTDDAWLGEQAYWLAKEGYVKSELFRGLLNYDTQQFVYHKLFIWLGALSIKIFGFNLYILKSISLIFLLSFLAIFYYYGKKSLKIEPNLLLAVCIIIVINPIVFYYGFVFRPEVMLMTLGFVAYIFLELSNENDNKIYAFMAGAFAGLSLLTHLNGLSFALAGFAALLIFKRYKLCFHFSLGVGLISSLYFVDLHSLSSLEGYLYQFKNDPALETNDYTGAWSYVHNLLTEHKRFFRDPKTLTFSIIVIALLLVGYKGLKGHSFLKIFTCLLIIIFATLAQSKTTKYIIIYLPYLWLIVALILQYIVRNRKSIYTKGIFVFLLIYFLVSIGYNLSSFKENRNNIRLHSEISQKYNLLNKNMVGPITFIFEQMGRQNIQSVRLYTFLRKKAEFNENGSFDFFELAEKFGNDAIVLTPESFDLLQIQIPSELGAYGNFQLIDIVNKEFYIYKHIRNPY